VDVPFRPFEAVLYNTPAEHVPDYFTILTQDEAKAADWLFNYFAGRALIYPSVARRWIVVHDREVSEWSNAEKHIGIYTPEKYMKTFGILTGAS
jgi:hypothetical protein